ncbi:MAG TPA: TraR/DksA family transcriptional regulator [Desulfuromonadaceae bacterium]|jgi:DnaK suppressor protein
MTQADDTRQAELQALLLGEKRRLWDELRVELFDNLGVDLHKQYDIPQDIGDRGILDLLEDTGLAVADIRREQLTQMDGAQVKLENGSYGICEDCGKEIDGARLQVAPYAPCCVVCQQRREGPEKLNLQY